MPSNPWDISAIPKFATEVDERHHIQGMHFGRLMRSDVKYDKHYPFEIGMVLSGSMRRYYQGWQVDIEPGQTWICGIWEPHGYHVTSESADIVVLMIWPPSLAVDSMQGRCGITWQGPFLVPADQRPVVGDGRRDEMLDIGRRLARAIDAGGDAVQMWMRCLLQEMLLCLQEDWVLPASVRLASSACYDRITPAIRLALESTQLVTEETAARGCKMSLNGFNKLFKGVMSMSFAKFALSFRLRGAAGQLAESDTPIKAVASRWGFSNPSHLHRWFVQTYGCTPRQYRLRYQLQASADRE